MDNNAINSNDLWLHIRSAVLIHTNPVPSTGFSINESVCSILPNLELVMRVDHESPARTLRVSSHYWDFSPQHLEVLRSDRRFTVLNAGRRWGKTTIALFKVFFHAASGPGRLCYYIGPSERQAKEMAWRAVKQIVPPALLGRKSESELEIELSNGSRIKIHGPHSLRGAGLDFVVLDEFAYMSGDVWNEIVRPMLADRQGGALLCSTPRGFDHFHDIFERAHSQPDWAPFHYTSADGGFISKTELQLLRSTMDPKLYDQEIAASFVLQHGRVYYAFSRELNVKDLWRYEGQPLLVGMDFNVNPMVCVVAQKIGSFCHVIDEIILPNSNTFAMMEELNLRYPAKPDLVRMVHPDPSGASRRTSAPVGVTDHAIIRAAGWEVHTVRRAYALVDRRNCVNAMFQNANGERRLLIDRKCRNLIRSLEGLTFIPGSHIPDKKSGFDHLCDALGYLVTALSPMMRDEVTITTQLI